MSTSPPSIALCVHGHFYQPPRENPWTDEVPREPSAAPHHDWNARIRRAIIDKNVRIPEGIELGFDHEADRRRGLSVFAEEDLVVVPKGHRLD